MIDITNKFDCCGCEACTQICPKQIITMKHDSQGFLYPLVNQKDCIKCNLCNNVCPMGEDKEKRIPLHTYAVKNKDLQTRHTSSSGGVFSILAEATINSGGVVYGAVFDNDWMVTHKRIDNINDLVALRGSKYVQSKMDGIYKSVKQDLLNGTQVLFSGCHCHIAALKKYLKKDYKNLTTIDVVCGGVPSPKIWQDFLKEEVSNFLYKHNKKKKISKFQSYIKSINFRDKSNGWRRYSFKICLEDIDAQKIDNRTTYIWEHRFMLSWLNQYISRPACHNCKVRDGRSGADYSIADFWGIDKFYPNVFDDNGVTMLLDYKGDAYSKIAQHAAVFESDYEHATCTSRAVTNSHPYNQLSKLYYFLHNTCHCSISTTLQICTTVEIIFDFLKRGKICAQYRFSLYWNKLCPRS